MTNTDFITRIKRQIVSEIKINEELIRKRVIRKNVKQHEDNMCLFCDGKIIALYYILNFIEDEQKEKTTEIKSGSYCPHCKHFVWCEWGKIVATALSTNPCTDFEDTTKNKLCKLIDKLDDNQIEYLYTFTKGVFGE